MLSGAPSGDACCTLRREETSAVGTNCRQHSKRRDQRVICTLNLNLELSTRKSFPSDRTLLLCCFVTFVFCHAAVAPEAADGKRYSVSLACATGSLWRVLFNCVAVCVCVCVCKSVCETEGV